MISSALPTSFGAKSVHTADCVGTFFKVLKMRFSSSLVNAFCPPLTSVRTSFPVCINLPPRPNENLMSLGGMKSYFRVRCDPAAAAAAAAESSISPGQVIVTNLHSIHICSLIFNARHCPPRCGSQSLFISVHYLLRSSLFSWLLLTVWSLSISVL